MAQPLTTSNRRRAIQVGAPVFAGLLLLGACSKKDDTATTTATTAAASSSSGGGGGSTTTAGSTNGTTTGTKKPTGTTPGTAVDANTVVVSTTVWYDGFKITLPNGKIDNSAQTLTFTDATIENLSTDNGSLYGDYSIEQDGTQAYTGRWTNTPSIIALSKAKDTLVFSIDEKFKPKAATMVMGTGAQQQVRIALDGSGKVTALQPVDQAVISPITLGQLTFTPKTVAVRYDRIDSRQQADTKKAYLYIMGDLKNNTPDATLYFSSDAVTLASPDGTKAAAEKVLGPGSIDGTQTDSKFGLVFVINDPFAGDYTLNFKGNWGASSTEATATANLTLVAAGKTSGTTSGSTPGSTPGTTK